MILIYLGMCTAIEEFDSACHCATDSKPYMTYPVMEILQHLGQYMEWSNKIILHSFSRHNVVVGRYGIVLSYRLAEVHWLTFITESADVWVYHYYTLAGPIYLGTYFTRCQDILCTFISYQGIIEWHLIYILAPLHWFHHQAFILLAIMIYIICTWQWSRNIFGHKELLLLVEEPWPVGVQLGDVDQVQLYRVFFPEHRRHSDSHLSFLLYMRHHQGHCTHMYEGGRSCWGKYFQKQLQQHFTKKNKDNLKRLNQASNLVMISINKVSIGF